LVTAATAAFNALELNIGKTPPNSASLTIEIRRPPGGGRELRGRRLLRGGLALTRGSRYISLDLPTSGAEAPNDASRAPMDR